MKQGIFEYVNLKKQVAKSKQGNDYTKYVIVSNVKDETKKVKEKLKELKFHWDGKNFQWFIWGNELTHKVLDGLKQINAELEAEGGQTEDINEFIDGLEQLRESIKNSDASQETKIKLDTLLDQFIEDLINATDEKAASAEIQKYLDFSHKFRQYSFWNSVLIYIQDPNATKVMGDKAWKKNFNRDVIDIEKKININCYNRFYRDDATGRLKLYTLDQQSKDKDYIKKANSGAITPDPKEIAAIDMRKKEVRVSPSMQYHDCAVYDIANTTGDPVPEEPKWMGEFDDNQAAEALFNIAKKSLEKGGIKVTQNSAFGREGGWSAGGHINVSSGAKGSGAVSVIFHEWAHELLHWKNGKFYGAATKYFEDKGMLTYAQVKQIKETQAETSSYVLCRYYGLPTGNHPTYLALWQSQGQLSSKQLLKENMYLVTDVCNYIIDQVEKYQSEFDVAKTQPQQQQGEEPAI